MKFKSVTKLTMCVFSATVMYCANAATPSVQMQKTYLPSGTYSSLDNVYGDIQFATAISEKSNEITNYDIASYKLSWGTATPNYEAAIAAAKKSVPAAFKKVDVNLALNQAIANAVTSANSFASISYSCVSYLMVTNDNAYQSGRYCSTDHQNRAYMYNVVYKQPGYRFLSTTGNVDFGANGSNTFIVIYSPQGWASDFIWLNNLTM